MLRKNNSLHYVYIYVYNNNNNYISRQISVSEQLLYHKHRNARKNDMCSIVPQANFHLYLKKFNQSRDFYQAFCFAF